MKISVIMPAYNRVATLARAIDSVIAQSYKVTEIIVVDDGSSDATSEVAKVYPEVLLLRQTNMGVSSARNNGVMMAEGDWIAFLDSDDTWHPKKLAFQVAFHKKNAQSKVSYTDEVWIRDDREMPIPKKFHKPETTSFENALEYCNIAPSSVLIKKSLYEKFEGFDESLEVCEDYDLWLRILQEHTIDLIPKKLMIKYGGASDQLSTKFWGMDRFRVRSLEKIFDAMNLKNPILIKTLIQKYELLYQGAIKHKKEDEAFHYQERLAFFKSF